MTTLYIILNKDNAYMNGDKYIGDILAAVSTLGYGFETTLTEKWAKYTPVLPYLIRYGLSGLVFSCLLACIFEVRTIRYIPY